MSELFPESYSGYNLEVGVVVVVVVIVVAVKMIMEWSCFVMLTSDFS